MQLFHCPYYLGGGAAIENPESDGSCPTGRIRVHNRDRAYSLHVVVAAVVVQWKHTAVEDAVKLRPLRQVLGLETRQHISHLAVQIDSREFL